MQLKAGDPWLKKVYRTNQWRLDDLGVQQSLKRSMARSLQLRSCVEKHRE